MSVTLHHGGRERAAIVRAAVVPGIGVVGEQHGGGLTRRDREALTAAGLRVDSVQLVPASDQHGKHDDGAVAADAERDLYIETAITAGTTLPTHYRSALAWAFTPDARRLAVKQAEAGMRLVQGGDPYRGKFDDYRLVVNRWLAIEAHGDKASGVMRGWDVMKRGLRWQAVPRTWYVQLQFVGGHWRIARETWTSPADNG